MMKIAALLFAFLLAGSAQASVASTVSGGKFFQDTVDVSGDAALMDTSLDLLNARVEITNDNNFRFWLISSKAPESSSGGSYAVVFDTDMDKQRDYALLADSENLSSNPSDVQVFNYLTESLETCQASAWTAPWGTKSSVVFELERSCFEVGKKVNLRFSTSQPDQSDGFNYDWLPGKDMFQTFTSDYLAGQICNSNKVGNKTQYLGLTMICQKVGSGWKYIEYGQVLAKKAKYATDKAYYLCLYGKYGAYLADGNKTLQIDAVGKDYISLGDFECVRNVMSIPSWLASQIGITRALDGMQKAGFGNYIATWTYHPDDGLNIVIRRK